MRKATWLLSAGLMALALPAVAQAQETDTDQGGAIPTQGATAEAGATDLPDPQIVDDGDEVIVTATRRNQALSNVPLAVSAVTAEQLKNSGTNDIRQLTQLSPSLLVSSTSSEASGGVARIRGVGTVGDNPGLESSVATFIDGVYRSRTGVGLTELGPVDRIEVLRGPQGTLFGRNASAGLISVITARPKFETEFGGAVTVGNYNLRRLEGTANSALSDTIAARVDGIWMKQDGFLNDVISGRDVNDRDRWLARGQLLYKPGGNLSVRIVADYAKRDEECCAAPYLPAHDTYYNNGTLTYGPSTIAAVERGLGAIINDDPYQRDVSITPGRNYASRVEDGGVSAEAVYDFGFAEMTSITAYRINDYDRGQDVDFNNLDILYRADDGRSSTKFNTFSQEVRFQGTSNDGIVDWLIGGYYANEKLDVQDNLSYGNDYSRFTNCLTLLSDPSFTPLLDTNSPSCINSTVLAGGQAQANAGVAQLQAGIAQIQAILANPALDDATRAALTAQLQGLIAQLQSVGATAALLNTLNAVPSAPGYPSLAAALGVGTGNDPFAGVGIYDTYDQTSNNFALFTHNIFKVTDKLDFTLGLRYTREKKTLDANLTDNNVFCRAVSASPLFSLQTLPCVIGAAPNGNYSGSSSKTENKISGTGVLSYKLTDDLMSYASYSKGYKAGGFNLDRSPMTRSNGNGAIVPNASFDVLQFEPETVNAYELGAKYNGRGFDMNVAVFREYFDNFQLNQFNGIAFEVANINGCDQLDVPGGDSDNDSTTGACAGNTTWGVRSQGVEVEMFTRPLRNVTFNLGMTYADTRYHDDIVAKNGAPASAQLFQLGGRQISNAPEFTATGSLGYTPMLTDSLMGLFYLDARHTSGLNTGSDLDLEKFQKAVTTLNGRVGVGSPDRSWSLEVWARNLLDANYSQVAFDAPLQGSGTERGVVQGFYPRSTQLNGLFLAEPRTFGLTLRGKFGPGYRDEVEVYDVIEEPVEVIEEPATQVCADGSVILATDACPVI